jgi:hypothetical protein
MTSTVLNPQPSSAGSASLLLRPAIGFILSNAALLALMMILTAA